MSYVDLGKQFTCDLCQTQKHCSSQLFWPDGWQRIVLTHYFHHQGRSSALHFYVCDTCFPQDKQTPKTSEESLIRKAIQFIRGTP